MVNYPHKLSSKPSKTSLPQTKNFANRGMSFEKMINATNDYYLSHGMAVIHKKPTPIQIVRVDYPQRSRAKIVEAYFRQASTTDYSGVYEGFYIGFSPHSFARFCKSGIRAIDPSSFIISINTPAGKQPESLQRSTAASV